jgi:predicted enzyme related to lactoylglutathione lyase
VSDEQTNAEISEDIQQQADGPVIGQVEWLDLTVNDATRVKNFYSKVVGWKSSDVDMGSYSDYSIETPADRNTVAGICHARGPNANIPSQWLVYVRVASVSESAEECKRLGGEVLNGPRRMGGSHFCIIKDPEGAVMALLSD